MLFRTGSTSSQAASPSPSSPSLLGARSFPGLSPLVAKITSATTALFLSPFSSPQVVSQEPIEMADLTDRCSLVSEPPVIRYKPTDFVNAHLCYIHFPSLSLGVKKPALWTTRLGIAVEFQAETTRGVKSCLSFFRYNSSKAAWTFPLQHFFPNKVISDAACISKDRNLFLVTKEGDIAVIDPLSGNKLSEFNFFKNFSLDQEDAQESSLPLRVYSQGDELFFLQDNPELGQSTLYAVLLQDKEEPPQPLFKRTLPIIPVTIIPLPNGAFYLQHADGHYSLHADSDLTESSSIQQIVITSRSIYTQRKEQQESLLAISPLTEELYASSLQDEMVISEDMGKLRCVFRSSIGVFIHEGNQTMHFLNLLNYNLIRSTRYEGALCFDPEGCRVWSFLNSRQRIHLSRHDQHTSYEADLLESDHIEAFSIGGEQALHLFFCKAYDAEQIEMKV